MPYILPCLFQQLLVNSRQLHQFAVAFEDHKGACPVNPQVKGVPMGYLFLVQSTRLVAHWHAVYARQVYQVVALCAWESERDFCVLGLSSRRALRVGERDF